MDAARLAGRAVWEGRTEDGARGIVASEAGLAHAGAGGQRGRQQTKDLPIVDDESGNFFWEVSVFGVKVQSSLTFHGG
jgi:hypothetical protein